MLSIFCRINALKLLRYVSTRTRRTDAGMPWISAVQSVCEKKMLRPGPSVSLLSDSIDMRRELASRNYIQHTHSWSQNIETTRRVESSSFSLTRFSSSWDEERASGSEIWVCRILKRSVHPAPRCRWTASPLIIRLLIYSTVVGGKNTCETCCYITTATCFVMNMLARIALIRVLHVDEGN